MGELEEGVTRFKGLTPAVGDTAPSPLELLDPEGKPVGLDAVRDSEARGTELLKHKAVYTLAKVRWSNNEERSEPAHVTARGRIAEGTRLRDGRIHACTAARGDGDGAREGSRNRPSALLPHTHCDPRRRRRRAGGSQCESHHSVAEPTLTGGTTKSSLRFARSPSSTPKASRRLSSSRSSPSRRRRATTPPPSKLRAQCSSRGGSARPSFSRRRSLASRGERSCHKRRACAVQSPACQCKAPTARRLPLAC